MRACDASMPDMPCRRHIIFTLMPPPCRADYAIFAIFAIAAFSPRR